MASDTPTPNSNLPLPPELRDKIFAELLVHPGRVLTLNPSKHKLPSFWRTPDEEDTTYAKQFLISLTLRLAREIRREPGHPPRRIIYGQIMGVDTAAFIKETWGEQALGLMRKVRLYINAKDVHIDETVKGKLRDLVRILREGKNVKQLSVRWENFYTYPKFAGKCGTSSVQEGNKIRRSSRREDGTREQAIKYKCWYEQEMILEPLKELRGLKQALVFGSVSDQWALWLEQCMKSDEPTLPGFNRVEGFPDVVNYEI